MRSAASILDYHRFCLYDGARDVYRRALAQAVRPGDVVLDIGAGSGVLSFLACQAGARRAYAIEANASIRIAQELSAHNGYQNRVVLLHDMSQRVQLPERADVLVTDTLETFGVNGGILEAAIDARKRLLKADCRMIPHAMELFVAPIELPAFYAENVEQWSEELFGLDLSPVRRYAANNFYAIRTDRSTLLGEPGRLAQIDFYTVETPEICGDVTLVATRGGVLHGLVGFFAADLAEGVRLSNAPGLGETEYAQALLPLDQPIELAAGDCLRIHIQSYDGDTWRWRVECFSRDAAGAEILKSRSDQSNFKGFPLSKDDFKRTLPSYRPKRSEKGQIELFILESLDGDNTIAQIEAELIAHYPTTFPSPAEASAYVREAVGKYS